SGICACGNYRVIGDEKEDSQFCEQCGVEFVDSRIRRYQMGYIKTDMSCNSCMKSRNFYWGGCYPRTISRFRFANYYRKFVGRMETIRKEGPTGNEWEDRKL
ncbi:hypothetical protein HID58_094404, partial [Brassica napus]